MFRHYIKRLFISLNIIVLFVMSLYLMTTIVYLKKSSVPDMTSILTLFSATLSLEEQNLLVDNYKSKIKSLDRHLKNLSEISDYLPRNDSKLVFPQEIYEMTSMTVEKTNCSSQLGADLLLLVVVITRVDDFRKRQAIRQSWAQDFKSDYRSKIYFAVGLSKDTAIQSAVKSEDKIHSDLLQWSYYESYYNCTIKALAILRWTATNCPFVKFVLKTDDDTILLSDNLLEFSENTNADTIYGYLWQKPIVFRSDKTSKWAINTKDYPNDFYPDYIGGPWLIPGHKALDLYSTAILNFLPALPFEDVYITGILASDLNITRKPMAGLLYLNSGDDCDLERLDLCFHHKNSIFWQGINETSMTRFYKRIKSFDPKTCNQLTLHYFYSKAKYYFNVLLNGYKYCILV